MINHARCLLLNVARQPAAEVPGEEVIDPRFTPLALPHALQQVRRLLFGTHPDRYMLNYRGRQLMALLHSSELASHVLALDSRITYDLQTDPFADPALFQPRVSMQTTGSSAQPTVTILGDAGHTGLSGRLHRSWLVTVGSATADVTLLGNPPLTTSQAVTYTNGLSNQLTLPGSQLKCVVSETSFTLGNGPRFNVHSLVRPHTDLGQSVATLDQQGDEVLASLFGVGDPIGETEPFRTFHNLFRYRRELPYRLGGAVLALIYQTDLRRRQ